MRPVLHSIRTLVCTATNQTPHERMFRFERRTLTGHALPSWLLNKERALVRKQVRKSKYDDWVEECDILHVTPTYAQIRTDSGKEQTVSLRDLAPLPSETYESTAETPVDTQDQHVSEYVHLNRDTQNLDNRHLSSPDNLQHIIPPPAPLSNRSPNSTSNRSPNFTSNPIPNSTSYPIPNSTSNPIPNSAPTPRPSFTPNSENVLRRSSRARCETERLNYDKLGGTNAMCDFMNLFATS